MRRLPSVVLEILAGILVGPAVLGIVHVDEAISVISALGLGLPLFLAGLEIDFDRLAGRPAGDRCSAFVVSFGIALLGACCSSRPG